MNIDRAEAREIGVPTPPLAARRELAAQALRPADSTEQWREYRARRGATFSSALEGVSLIEAPDERLEALTLALFMRRASGDAKPHGGVDHAGSNDRAPRFRRTRAL